jgi:hypothetical protein
MTTPTPGLNLDATIALQLCASLDGLTAEMRRDREARQRQMEVIRQVPFAGAIAISGGIGVYDQPDQLQAKTGYIWDIRRLTVQGFSAGTVTAYRNGAMNPVTGLNPGEPTCPYPAPAVNTFTKASQLLMPGDRLCFGATGITLAAGYGQVQFWGVASCFQSWYMPYYLG